MAVTLIDCTGFTDPNPGRYAANLLVYAKSTRLDQDAATMQKIKLMSDEDMDRELMAVAHSVKSSWEFIDYTFQVYEVTRAYSLQQVRTRHGSYAQQSQRSVDFSKGFEYLTPDSVIRNGKQGLWTCCMQMIASTYKQLAEAGIPTQDARGVLPNNSYTKILCKFNLRTLSEMVARRDNLRAQGEYAEQVREMARLATEVHPWTKEFLYPTPKRTPALDRILAKELDGRSPASVPDVNDALKELDALKGTWG